MALGHDMGPLPNIRVEHKFLLYSDTPPDVFKRLHAIHREMTGHEDMGFELYNDRSFHGLITAFLHVDDKTTW